MNHKLTSLGLGDTVKDNSRDYLDYHIRDHYPSAIDGLKAVYRRIVYSLRNSGLVDSTIAVGRTFEFHPHGDNSIYDTIVRMSQPFNIWPTLIFVKGRHGSYSAADDYASHRYTKSSVSDFSKDVYLGINMDTLRYQISENLATKEPEYFIPKVPMALVYNMSNIGYGFTSRPITFDFSDVCDLAIHYVQSPETVKDMYKTLVPVAHGNSVKNFHEVYEKMMDGKFDDGEIKIKFEGIIELLSDTALKIRVVGAGSTLSGIKDTILEKLKDKNCWLSTEYREFKDLSGRGNFEDANLYLKFKANTNIFKAIEQLSFVTNGTISVYNNYELRGMMKNMTIEDLLKVWYDERVRSTTADVRKKIKDTQFKLMRIEVLFKYVEHIDEMAQIIKAYDEKNVRDIFREKYKITSYQTDIILDTGPRVLMRTSKAQLEEDKTSLIKRFKDLVESLKDVDKIIVEELVKIKSRYSKAKFKRPEFSKIRDYKGLLVTTQGYILIEDYSEIPHYQTMESSKFECVDFIRFEKEPNYIDNKIYVSRRGASLLEESKSVSNKFSTAATLIMSPKVDKTIVLTKTGRLTIYEGITIVPKSPDSRISYMSGDIGIITSDLSIVKKSADAIKHKMVEGKYSLNRQLMGVFELPKNLKEGEFLILVFMNGNRLSLVRYSDNLDKIKLLSDQLTFLGSFISSDTNNIFIHDEKWYQVEMTDKLLAEFNKFTYREVSLIKAKLKITN